MLSLSVVTRLWTLLEDCDRTAILAVGRWVSKGVARLVTWGTVAGTMLTCRWLSMFWRWVCTLVRTAWVLFMTWCV